MDLRVKKSKGIYMLDNLALIEMYRRMLTIRHFEERVSCKMLVGLVKSICPSFFSCLVCYFALLSVWKAHNFTALEAGDDDTRGPRASPHSASHPRHPEALASPAKSPLQVPRKPDVVACR